MTLPLRCTEAVNALPLTPDAMVGPCCTNPWSPPAASEMPAHMLPSGGGTLSVALHLAVRSHPVDPAVGQGDLAMVLVARRHRFAHLDDRADRRPVALA